MSSRRFARASQSAPVGCAPLCVANRIFRSIAPSVGVRGHARIGAGPWLRGRRRGGNARLTLLAETPSRRLPAPGRGHVLAGPRQTEARHVVVDGLVPSGLDEIRLMPD